MLKGPAATGVSAVFRMRRAMARMWSRPASNQAAKSKKCQLNHWFIRYDADSAPAEISSGQPSAAATARSSQGDGDELMVGANLDLQSLKHSMLCIGGRHDVTRRLSAVMAGLVPVIQALVCGGLAGMPATSAA
jgi:hypothetical protein